MLNKLMFFMGREKRCPSCEGVMTAGSPLCPDCLELLKPRTGGYCTCCGTMFGREDDEPGLCSECRLEPRPWTRLYFHSPYAGRLREMILAYKFSGRLGLGRLLQEMAVLAFEQEAESLPELIIPVPLHPKRLFRRGFNQSLELGRLVSAKTGRPIAPDALRRVRNTTPQSRLKGKERLENLRGAFRAAEERVRDRSVLLVDDVLTTGATIAECSKILAKAGAARVDVLVLAKAGLK